MAIQFDDLFTKFADQGIGHEKREVTFLPEPERRERSYTIVSVDDHLVEPPDTFEGRMPKKFAERAPRVVDTPNGGQAWLFDGEILPNIGFNAVAGRPFEEHTLEPVRFEHMRKGAWDVDARIHDMDLNGCYASMCFPSFLAGFGGGRINTVTKDQELALAALRAWNDWHLEAWCGAHPDRFIPLQLPWLHDPELAAEEVRRNAVRGFKALSFPETPEKLGFPSLHRPHWDPLWRACEETETVVCAHVGSAGTMPDSSPDAPPDLPTVLFGGYAMLFTADWLYSMIPVRFPKIKITMSEGGIGWVAGLLDRLDHCTRYREFYRPLGRWAEVAETPAEVLQRNFWFCAVNDPTAMRALDRIGTGHVCYEVDYPHSDSSWPDSQDMLRRQMAGLAPDVVERVTWRNASELYRHPVPAEVQRDPNAY